MELCGGCADIPLVGRSWLIARDVQQARLHMDLSRWQDYSTDDRLRLLSEIGSTPRNRQMPLPRYLLLHPEARLTDTERQHIYRWTRANEAVYGCANLKQRFFNSPANSE